MFCFMKGKMERIKRSVAYNIYTYGGLGIFHNSFAVCCNAYKTHSQFPVTKTKPWVRYASYCPDFALHSSLVGISLTLNHRKWRRDQMLFIRKHYSTFTLLRRNRLQLIFFQSETLRIISCVKYNCSQMCFHGNHGQIPLWEKT